jgi:nuclease-like protein
MHVSHPRRMELEASLSAAIALGLAMLALAAAMVMAASAVPVPLVGVPCVAGVWALVRMRNAAGRAARARVGRQSEQTVARRLRELAQRGWTVNHSITWPGRGDIDHVAVSPAGTVFVIETKTRSYGPAHLDRTRAAADAVGHKRRGGPARAVLCIARGRGVRTVERDVLVVSEDVLASTLRDADHDTPTSET